MTKENLKIPLTLKFLSFVCIFLWTIFLFIAYVVFGSIDVSEILNVSWGYAFALLLPIVLFPLILFWIFKKNKRLLYITIIVLTVVLFLLDVLLTTDPWFNLLNYSFLVILLTVFLLFFYPKNKLLWIFLFLHIIWLITWYLNLYSFEDVFDIYTTGRIIGDIIFLILVVGQFIFIKKNYDLIKNNDNKISWVKRNLLFTIWIIAIIVSLYIYLNEYELFWISIAIISVFVLLQISLTTRLKCLFVYLYSRS